MTKRRGTTKRWLVALMLGATVTGTAACTDGEEPAPPGCDAAFGAWARAGFTGVIAVSAGGRLECLAGHGTAADTVFGIGSVSKAFTAAAILQLADAGKLSLDDPVGKLVPAVTGPVARATVRRLLLHTSGLTGSIGPDDQPLTRAGAIAAINRLPSGTGYSYSNAGYTLLAIIVDTVSGMPYRDYLRTHVLEQPGGFSHPGDHWATEGNGSLTMTTATLASWVHTLFHGASAALAAAPAHPLGDGRSQTLGGWIAFDPQVYGQPIAAVAGGGGDTGHNTAVVWIPAQDRVVVMASTGPGLTAEELLAATVTALVAGDPLPTPTPPTGSGDPAAVAGTYPLRTGGSFEVTVAGDRPRIAAIGADAVTALFPPHGRFSAAGLRAHEQRVLAMLAGRTAEGRDERAAVEAEHGPISAVTPAGTLVADGEMRTYVTLTTRDGPIRGWYAVDDHSTIEGAELPAEPPALTLTPVGAHRYRPAGTGPDVTLEFTSGRLTLTGPAGPTTTR